MMSSDHCKGPRQTWTTVWNQTQAAPASGERRSAPFARNVPTTFTTRPCSTHAIRVRPCEKKLWPTTARRPADASAR